MNAIKKNTAVLKSWERGGKNQRKQKSWHDISEKSKIQLQNYQK